VIYDALLYLSFGGPQRPEDVIPFLENVTRGREIPRTRLEAVAQHYWHFGGVSPINDCNRAVIAELAPALTRAGFDLPVYFGNRNWHPLIERTVMQMADDGVRSALVFVTSAWAGFSGCLQYHHDIARAREAVGVGAPRLRKLRQYFDHPLLIAAFADAIREARRSLPDDRRQRARLVFTAHSVPVAADRDAGPPSDGGGLYRRQVAEAAGLCAAAAGFGEHDVVWQSRSGSPRVPWLAPDIVEYLEALSGTDVDAVIVCPVGFVSDHLEVVWDLDHEAAAAADRLDIAFARAATPGTDPRFVELVIELVAEQIRGTPARRLGAVPSYGCAENGNPCAARCCGSA
jgi:protoporphyrin/coproporphyrin ferrochelatase